MTTWEVKELRPRQPLGLGLWWSLLEKTSVMLNSKASSNTASMDSKCLHSPGQGRYRPCSLCHSSHACPGGSSYLNMLIVDSRMYHNTHRPLQCPMATTEAVTVEGRQEADWVLATTVGKEEVTAEAAEVTAEGGRERRHRCPRREAKKVVAAASLPCWTVENLAPLSPRRRVNTCKWV